jgi:uncharacterized protein
MSEFAPTVVRLADVVPQSWKNGGGVTRELLAWPRADDWMLRVSIADIDSDGAFSSFPDVTRYFAVLSGNGIALEGVGELRVGDAPVQFDGDVSRHCRLLDGSTRDLNVMIRRDFGEGLLRRVAGDSDLAPTPRAAVHGVFGASNGVLSWREGSNALGIAREKTRPSSLFYFAFRMHELPRSKLINL